MEGARASRAKRLIRIARHLNFWFCASKFVILSKGEVQGCIPLAARRPPSDERQGAAPEATMSGLHNSGNAKITVPDLLQRKSQAADAPSNCQKSTCQTAHGYPTATQR